MTIIFDSPHEVVHFNGTEDEIHPGDPVLYMLGQEPIEGWAAVDAQRMVTWVDDMGLRREGNPLVFVSDAGVDQVPLVYTTLQGKCHPGSLRKKAPSAWIDEDGELTPGLYTEQIRRDKMAYHVAKVHGRKRGDGSSVGIFVPLPSRLAKKFPSNHPHDGSPSHVTLMILGSIPQDRQEDLLGALRSTLQSVQWPRVKASLAGLGSFDQDDRSVPHAKVEFDKDMEGLRHKIKQALRERGFKDEENYHAYKPHVTLGFLPAGKRFAGRCPRGSWEFDTVEVWGLPKVHRLPIGSGKKAAKVASKWLSRLG